MNTSPPTASPIPAPSFSGDATRAKASGFVHAVKYYPAGATTNYNEALAQVTLVVSPWHVTGFYTPVTMGGASVVNTIKGGSTVPLKFNIYRTVGGVELTGINDIGAFHVYTISCSAGTVEDPIELTTTGETSLRYDATNRHFIQNWQAPKGAGSCYRVAMTSRDGTSLDAYFKTK